MSLLYFITCPTASIEKMFLTLKINVLAIFFFIFYFFAKT